MRLIRLKVKNIASLKGEHLVDFEQIQSHSSLFAITGETGSGKSTVLNCIGLALYGDIYKKNVTQVDVVTLGEKEGEIQLIFQVAGKFYIADWRAKVRKQNGELLQKPLIQRQVFDINGTEFTSTRGEVVESVERLLNLDFDQFCKCIILNQGEFARFLSSSFSERKDILEKLYPGELYDSLGKELKRELDEMEREKNDISIKLGELKIDALSGEDLQKEKDRLRSSLELHENWSKKIETLESHFTSLTHYHTKYNENKKKADQVRGEMSTATTAFNEAMKIAQTITEQFEQARVNQEKNGPRLRDLLQKEEALKHCQEAMRGMTNKLSGLDTRVLTLGQMVSENLQRIGDWQRSHETLISGLKHPLDGLKSNRERLEKVFELYNELQLHASEQKSNEEKLQELEAQGKDLAQRLSQVQARLALVPADIKQHLEANEAKKAEHARALQARQGHEFKATELNSQIAQHEQELSELSDKIKKVSGTLLTCEQEQLSLETTLKLQELTGAIEICVRHAQIQGLGSCPVCDASVSSGHWGELLAQLNRVDMPQMRARALELSRLIVELQGEYKRDGALIKNLQEQVKTKTETVIILKESLKAPLASIEDIDREWKELHRMSLEADGLRAEENRLNQELLKARDSFARVRSRSRELGDVISVKEARLQDEARKSEELIRYPLSAGQLDQLKEDHRLLSQLLRSEIQGEKLDQEQKFIQKELSDKRLEVEEARKEKVLLEEKINDLSKTLHLELGGKSANELIMDLARETRELQDKKDKADKHLKLHDDVIKDCRGKLYALDEQLKEYDLLYVKELHAVRGGAIVALPEIKERISALLKNLLGLALDFTSPPELFIPIQEILREEREIIKKESNDLREDFAGVGQKLADWEKRQDKIKVLEIAGSELQNKIDRQERLSGVLGKDELRSFVLSLVEENLIIQTNEELQKLCQGRYEIIHQSRGKQQTPEFYILDKYREGGRRKVSTLSGGETFMVSLAMALALAEMTRGQAEIDSLFIDEGFGTLDQDSLEDVLDVLNQIQTRGLMVGVISHIKTLTDAIPVNLVLIKKQDGTSSISIRAN